MTETAGETEARPGAAGGEHARVLSQLFECHNRVLVAFLASRLGNEEEAMEVAQEAYVKLLQLDRPGAISFLRAYLFRTAANLAVDRLRRRSRAQRLEPVYDEDELTDTRSPGRQAIASEELAIVRRALLELPEHYRQAFLMRRFDELDTTTIGQRLGVKETQVRTYLRRVVAYCQLRVDGVSAEAAQRSVFS